MEMTAIRTGECQSVGSIQSMPIHIHDTERLADLAGDQLQLLVGQPTDIDLNMQEIAR